MTVTSLGIVSGGYRKLCPHTWLGNLSRTGIRFALRTWPNAFRLPSVVLTPRASETPLPKPHFPAKAIPEIANSAGRGNQLQPVNVGNG